MDTIGLDLHKRESQLCIGGDDGSVEERRIVTSRERFSAVLGEVSDLTTSANRRLSSTSTSGRTTSEASPASANGT